MNCNDIENRISGYLDGELSSQEMKQFEEHTDSCSKCAALVSEMKSLDGILHEMEEPLPDEAYWGGFDARLSEKIEKASAPRSWWNIFAGFNKTQWALAAIAIMMIIAFPLVWEIIFSNKTATLPRHQAEISTPASDIRTTDKTMEDAMKNKKKTVPEEAKEKDIGVAQPAPPGELAMKEPVAEELVEGRKATVAGKPPGPAVKSDKPSAPFVPSDSGVEALPKKKPVAASVGSASRNGRVAGDDEKPITAGKVSGYKTFPEMARPKPIKPKAVKRESTKSRVRVAPKRGVEGALSGESDKKGRSVPAKSTGIDKFYRRAPRPAPAAPPAPRLAAKPAPPAGESSGGGLARGGRKAVEHEKKDEDGLPVSESFDDFDAREETVKESVEVSDYLATSEVVLIKIVSMAETKTGLKLIRNELSRANYVESLNCNARRFKRDPLLRRHTKTMQGITNEVMNIKPAGIQSLKRKVISSGLIERTKEIGK
ncbi:MAG: zf-HC2 domain-containing protein [Candidatus Eremiobacteraeota bacterium]|nr:zf-HC2 domain-containing protein [Candidatus Eremiobacteraeota bacterium]